MNALKAINRLTALLLLIIGGLGYGFFHLWQAQLNSTAQQEQAGIGVQSGKMARNAVAIPALPGYLPPPISAFNEVLERPLFEESRTKPKVPVVQQTAVPMTPLNLRLEGVAMVDERSVALVRDLTTKELYRLSIGMEYQGWIVGRIDYDMAEFKRGDEIRELLLELDENTNPAAQMASQRLRASRDTLRERRRLNKTNQPR